MSARRAMQVDWRGWRGDIARRLDRPVIVGAFGLTVLCVALMFVHSGRTKPVEPAIVAAQALFWLTTVTATLLALAAAMVAVARGASAWLAYSLAGIAIVLAALGADFVFDPYSWLVKPANRHLTGTAVAHLTWLSIHLALPGLFYVCVSNAAHHARLLRSLDVERAAETERLVQQRLQTELATIDHDLVLTAMRLALPLLASEAAQAEELLGAVTAYLRAAQQRGAVDAQGVADALRELRLLCRERSGATALG